VLTNRSMQHGRTKRQEKAEEFDSEDEAGKPLETLAQPMRRQGYQDL
jgi:predicted DNA-binding WGR domain protein